MLSNIFVQSQIHVTVTDLRRMIGGRGDFDSSRECV